MPRRVEAGGEQATPHQHALRRRAGATSGAAEGVVREDEAVGRRWPVRNLPAAVRQGEGEEAMRRKKALEWIVEGIVAGIVGVFTWYVLLYLLCLLPGQLP